MHLALLVWIGLLVPALAQEVPMVEEAPIRVLVIAGGGHHDFEANTQTLLEGVKLQYPRCTWQLLRKGPGPFPKGVPDAKVGLDDPELGQHFDAILAYSQGELGWSDADKAGFLKFVRAGGGYVALHSAGDSHPGWTEYDALLGGRFESHPAFQKIKADNVSPDHDALRCFHGPFEVEDEFYHLKNCRFDDKLLLMTGHSPGDPAGAPARPVAWAKQYGVGRVFYTILGHGMPTHEHPAFHSLVGQALLWATTAPRPLADGTYRLFDGQTLTGWSQTGPGKFNVVDGCLESEGGMGMLWYRDRSFRDFVLTLEWQSTKKDDNSGVFVRFPTVPLSPWDAVKQGYEVQICDSGGAKHRTGSIYDFQDATELASKPAGEWNRYEITVRGQEYAIALNGKAVARFTGDRGREGFIGLQNHDENSKVRFRNLSVKEIE